MDSHERRSGAELPAPTGQQRSAAETHPAADVLEWRVHLALERPRAMVFVVCVLLASAALAYAAFGHPLPVAITLALLFTSVSEFVLPVTYRLTADGVTRRNGVNVTSLAWRDVRRRESHDDGVRLSPLARPSALDAFRGVTLRFPADEAVRMRLLDALRVYSPEADPKGERDADG